MNAKLPGTSSRVEIAATLYAQGVRMGMLDALSVLHEERKASIEAADVVKVAILSAMILKIKEHAEVLAEKELKRANKP